MKNKIFITGAVREYDSAAPELLAQEIKEYICNNIVSPDCVDAVNVIVDEPSANMVRIQYHFSPDHQGDVGMISREMYRCFTGEYSGFVAENSCWWRMSFGPSFPMNVYFPVEDIIEAHKRDTRHYKADRYKNIEISEAIAGLTVKIQF